MCAISSLGYDHMEVLGDTLEKIAWQKGGICKPDSPAFTSPQFPSPMRVLAERAREVKVRTFVRMQVEGHPSNQDTLTGPKGGRIRGSPLYTPETRPLL